MTRLTQLRAMCIVLVTIAVLVTGSALMAGEHPEEHPQEHAEEHTQEHPEEQEPMVTRETLARDISDYLKGDAALKGGFFLIYDRQDRKALTLTLDRVHDDRLAKVGKDLYFACADFKTPENRLYDLDFFMRKSESGLQVNEITIHKVGGIARYTWKEEQGVWKRQ